MVKLARVAAAIGLGLLGACTRVVDDPLAERSIYWGLEPNPEYRGELPQVLFSADAAPARQGLLYTAMVEAEVASQFAGFAQVAERPDQVRSAIGELLYALDPEAAPPWQAKSAGIVEGWAGRGYGVSRAAAEMASAIRVAANQSDASAALREFGPRAATCADNTLARADRIVVLGREVLDGPGTGIEPLLEQIHDLARQLNHGAADGGALGGEDRSCGLQQTKRLLDRLGTVRSG